MSNVLVITTSLRPNSNSDILTERLIAGAKDAGHQVEEISLKGKNLKFCGGLGGPGEASAKKEALDKAYEFGRSIE